VPPPATWRHHADKKPEREIIVGIF